MICSFVIGSREVLRSSCISEFNLTQQELWFRLRALIILVLQQATMHSSNCQGLVTWIFYCSLGRALEKSSLMISRFKIYSYNSEIILAWSSSCDTNFHFYNQIEWCSFLEFFKLYLPSNSDRRRQSDKELIVAHVAGTHLTLRRSKL